MKLGSIEVLPTISRREILTMLLWGKPGVGKTVLASTAPGKKLWMQFDPAGTASLVRSHDILVADFSAYKTAQLEAFKQGAIIESDLLKLIREHGIQTVVVDSLTSFGQMALHYGIITGKASGKNFKASIEHPGQTGYGIRSAMILDFITMVLRVCADTKCHCILTAHDKESSDEAGATTEITFNLGGQGGVAIPAKISEIWYVEDTGRVRNIYLRAHGVKRPMRTRMFVTDERTFFTVKYNQDNPNERNQDNAIATWYKAWEENGFAKIPVPRD
jgi:hypothetical protein